ncbi:MAG: C40 family peptidase [Tenacibaculum sp.]|nr:C40 family peptidase [Tenacibaculum sp.]
MIIKLLINLILIFSFTSCNTSKESISNNDKIQVTPPKLTDKIIWTAVTYKGTPYKYGGTTKKGMDCSGLVYTCFKKRGISLPRSSSKMYKRGRRISLKNVVRGDLLFFTTGKSRSRINHVGLVTSARNGDIKFIHSTNSQGVIVTSLHSRYWKKTFIGAKRIL